jgi:putative hydrolase of the HAD superfamily
LWAPTYRRESWIGALAEYGIDDLAFAEHLAETFAKERRRRHTVYSEVERVLRNLRKKYQLALLTNGLVDLQREKLRGGGLEEYFDVIVVSGEVGVGKPDGRVFARVLDRLRVGCEDAVMVGDSLRRDVAGAQEAGLKGVWINRNMRGSDGSISPDCEIGSLSDLQSYLCSLE